MDYNTLASRVLLCLETLECKVCTLLLKQPKVTECGLAFCKNCDARWTECPNCGGANCFKQAVQALDVKMTTEDLTVIGRTMIRLGSNKLSTVFGNSASNLITLMIENISLTGCTFVPILTQIEGSKDFIVSKINSLFEQLIPKEVQLNLWKAVSSHQLLKEITNKRVDNEKLTSISKPNEPLEQEGEDLKSPHFSPINEDPLSTSRDETEYISLQKHIAGDSGEEGVMEKNNEVEHSLLRAK